VEFTLHGEDILPGASVLRAMEEGTAGHKARQASLPAGWQSEVPLELTIPLDDDDSHLLVSGRMDAFLDGITPAVEEIKLWSFKEPPEEPVPAHMAQAVCYGHILCETRGCEAVDVSVAYVNVKGKLIRSFGRSMSGSECRDAFTALLFPYLRRLRALDQHERARDASLQALPFPFESYRPGQRKMAVQVYTAIRLRRRLFAQMPTGTGKSAAALYPALKAMGMGLTEQVFYLTARTTQRQGPLEALSRMRQSPLSLWVLTLDAKDKQCPDRTLCHPDYCPRAKGHFTRDAEAIAELLAEQDWSPERIREKAEEHCLCPFEFSLSLAELADVVICDYNYALDPAVHIQRIFDRSGAVTLLIDEAHNLLPRLRDMLSGRVCGADLRRLRRAVPRRHPLYKAMTEVLKALTDLPVPEDAHEGLLTEPPQTLSQAVLKLTDAFADADSTAFPWSETGVSFNDTLSDLLSYAGAIRRAEQEKKWIWQGRRDRTVTAFAPDAGTWFHECTRRMRGVVCFSATLSPLSEIKTMLCGDEEDACFAVPSPYPREHLTVLRRDINTRYTAREASAPQIARAIEELWLKHPGRCIVYFPSFAYLRMVSEQLAVPHRVQTQGMTDADRAAFLQPYHEATEPVLSLCVLGGVFAEGIDLPGSKLEQVVIVGLGLPQVNIFQEVLRSWYEEHFGQGYLYAYLLPGMQKVAQAVGRLIRSETDTGTALLLDDRYRRAEVRVLLPEHWDVQSDK